MEAPEKEMEDPRVMVNVSQSAGHDFTNQLETNQDLGQDPTHSHEQIQNQSQSRRDTDGWKLQQQWEVSLQPAFQDSNLSPALPLLTVNTEAENMFTEYSLFHQSDNEFSPLRPYPDISMASERFQCPPEDYTTQSLECASLSQHPLAQETILSEEEQISCYSLSQHSLSPTDKSSENQPSGKGTGENKKSPEPPDEPPDKPVREEAVEAEALFLKKEIPAEQLLELLQKDIETRSGSSAFSSSSQTSVKFTASSSKEPESSRVFKLDSEEGTVGAEDQDETLLHHEQPDRDIHPDQPGTMPPGSFNITMGPRSSQPDDSSEALHRELLSEVERSRVREAESEKRQKKSPSPPAQFITPLPTETYRGEQSVAASDLRGEPGVEPLSTAVVQGHREPDLWSSGNQTGIDGSYLGFLPQSQSTPGVFSAPPKSSVKRPLGQLSAIESDNSSQSDTGMPPQPVAVHHTDVSGESQEEAASAEVQSLPTVNFKQKVDAWRANQGSGNMSLFDSLALQGFSGVSPKKRAYDAVSDTLNGILSQQVRSLNLPPGSYAANQDAAQSSSFAQAGSSALWRGEAAGSAPGEEENTGSAPGPSTSTFNQSQFHSAHSTAALRPDSDQQTEGSANQESLTQSDIRHHPSASAHPSALVTLDQFSDISPDPDSTFSGSRESHGSMVKQEISVGASSVVSLEVDNYAPYWTSRASTPPPQLKPRELNIEERIPLYLHNLGIDQSPSTILNPFAPRGPIREPEFSPTDLRTIKGSVGTSTRSSQPSEGSSPQKGEFSRSSILSVDSSISVPISLDSLGPAASVPEQTGHTSPSGTEALQGNYLLEPSSQYDEDSYPSTVQTALRQQRGSSLTSSQNTIQPGDGFDSDLSSLAEARDMESHLGISRCIEEPSLVSSTALSEVHKLLPQAESMVSAGSSAAFSTSAAAPHTLSAEDILLSLRKKIDRLPDFSGTSSGTEDLRSGPSSLWMRSSSDSMLTSEKLRERSVGQENRSLSAQPVHPSTQPSITTATEEAYEQPEDGAVGRGAGPPFVLSQSAHRAEPEGCSAAPLDATVPPQLAVIKPPPAVDTQQLAATLTVEGSITEEEKPTPVEGPARSSNSSTPPHEDSDQAAMSDASSESSLAVRVAKLLQKETSATMMSITSSITDQEESRAREWIKLKISGQQCEPLELDKEDRMRIEEIKRELLLLNPIRSQESTDTESSAASSAKDPTQPVENFSADHRGQQSLSAGLSPSSLQLPNAPRQDLEAQIRAIAAKEGVTLSRASHRAFTSITIATRRRSTSPSPSTSPTPPLSPTLELLHLNELSTGAVSFPRDDLQLPETTTAPSLGQSSSLDSNLVNQAAASQTRQETVGGQFEDVAPLDFIKHQNDNIPSVGKADDLPVSQVTRLSRPESPSRPGHISYVHLTLSPKAVGHILPPAGHSRHLSSAAISPDEGVGLSSPQEWYDNRDPIRERPPERVDTCALFKISDLQGRSSPTSPSKPVTTLSSARDVILTRPQHSESPAVPVLLPYKPHGSEELFYIPQTEAGFLSDTTVESSHPDSDDAAPPLFSSDILGNGDPTLDRGVSIRHTEGIYSKRRKTAGLNMLEPECRGALAGSSSRMFVDQGQRSSSQVSVSTVPPSRNQEFLKTDRGTSPVQFPPHDQPEPSRESFQPVRMELQQHHLDSSSDLSLSAAQQNRGNLDQLWGKFCSQWRQEESRLSAEREASLLERLERLSRLMRYTKDVNPPGTQRGPEEKTQRRWDDAVEKERKSKMRAGRPRGELPVPHQARTQRLLSKETDPPVQVDSFSSITHSQSLRPADRDLSETTSTASGSVSTVDTTRMVRVFGADRVQILKSSSSIRKLYRTINEQKEGKNKEPPRVVTLSETSNESVVAADSESSTSTYILPSRRRTPAAGKGVGLVSRGIQAGDLELVWNGTRRHTRDVGITFPPPRESETHLHIPSSTSSAGSERGRGGQRSPVKTSSSQRRRKIYPKGISWYISADELRSEARKENRRDEGMSAWGRSTAWFEPYSRIKPWREPLRQRQVPEERNRRHRTARHGKYEVETRTKMVPPGGAPMSLQESLLRHRPEFIHQSRQRVERLALQAEERRLQEFFGGRQEIYGRHGDVGWLPRPAGTALLRRAVPRKEMILRSKQIYESLPEVQRRRAEERRKAEYESYRLNARLYNKRITNRVLNRRTAWH